MNTRTSRTLSALAVAATFAILSCDQTDKSFDNPADQTGSDWHPPSVHLPNSQVTVGIKERVTLHAVARASGDPASNGVTTAIWQIDNGRKDSVRLSDSTIDVHASFDSARSYRIQLWARSSKGILSAPETLTVVARIDPPSIRLASRQLTVGTKELVSFQAFVHATGNVDSNKVTSVVWQIVGQDTVGVQVVDSTATIRTKAFAQSNTYQVLLWARSRKGVLSAAPETLTVVARDFAPTVRLPASQVDVRIRDQISLQAVAYATGNADSNKVVGAVWQVVGKDTSSVQVLDSTISLTTSFPTTGTYQVQIWARSRKGILSEHSEVITVVAHSYVPTVSISAPARIPLGDSVTATASAKDTLSDSKIVKYLWKTGASSTIDTTTAPKYKFRPSASGSATVWVAAMDDLGQISSFSSAEVAVLDRAPLLANPAPTGMLADSTLVLSWTPGYDDSAFLVRMDSGTTLPRTVVASVTSRTTASIAVPWNSRWNVQVVGIGKGGDSASSQVQTFQVPKDTASDARLASLSVANFSIAFNGVDTSYDLVVPLNQGSIWVSWQRSYSGQTVLVDGSAVGSAATNKTINLGGGTTDVKVAVRSQNGRNTKTYHIVVRSQTSDSLLLNGLAVAGITLNPSFSTSNYTYSASIVRGDSAQVGWTTRSGTPTVAVYRAGVAGASVLHGSATDSLLEIRLSHSGISYTNSYWIRTSILPSHNAALGSLSVGSIAVSPSFQPGTTSYSAQTPVGDTLEPIQFTRGESHQKVYVNDALTSTGFRNITLMAGTNPVTLRVVAEDGTTERTYSVSVVRPMSTDAHLSSIKGSAGTLAPAFDSAASTYILSYPFATDSVSITPAVLRPSLGGWIRVNGKTVSSGGSSAKSSTAGTDTIRFSVVVAAEDTAVQRTYTVKAVRAPGSTNAALAGLLIKGVAGIASPLSPTFDSSKTTYTATMFDSTVTVTSVLADTTARLFVNGTAIPNKTTSGSLPLTRGDTTTISVMVKAQDTSKSRTYTVKVYRDTMGIGSISAQVGKLYNAGNGIWYDTLDYGVTSEVLTASASGNISYNGASNGTLSLSMGSTPSIVVKATTGASEVVDTVKIVRRSVLVNSNLATGSKFLEPYYVHLRVDPSVDTTGLLIRYTVDSTPTAATSPWMVNNDRVVRIQPSRFIASAWRNGVQLGPNQTFDYQMDSCSFKFDQFDSSSADQSQWALTHPGASDLPTLLGLNVYDWAAESSTRTVTNPTSVIGTGKELMASFTLNGTNYPSYGLGVVGAYLPNSAGGSSDLRALKYVEFTVRTTRATTTLSTSVRVNLGVDSLVAPAMYHDFVSKGIQYGWDVNTTPGTAKRVILDVLNADIPTWYMGTLVPPTLSEVLKVFGNVSFSIPCSTSGGVCTSASGTLEIDDVVLRYK